MLTRLLLSSVIVISTPAIAYACGNAIFLDGDDASQQVKQAEKLLAAGKNKQALQKVEPYRYRFNGKGLQRRAVLVQAAIKFRAPKINYRSAEFYIGYLEKELEGSKDDPLLTSLLAEGYAVEAETAAKATEMLEDLAKRELMPDAFGYIALGTLRAKAGDQDGAKAALTLCKKMTKHKALCKVSKAKPKGKSPQKAKSKSRLRS